MDKTAGIRAGVRAAIRLLTVLEVAFAAILAAAGLWMAVDLLHRTICYGPFESQQRFHLLTTRFKGFSGPVGSGKSAALCQEALLQAYLNSNCMGLVGAPTYRMLADVTRSALLRLIEENGVPHTFEKSENAITLHEPGSRIIFRSLDQPERLVGTNLAWFGCDELTYSKENSWERLEARLREPRARSLCGFAVWTPKGFDWVYRRFVSVADRKAGYDAIFARPGENKALPADFYEHLKSSYDERFYKQEVLGEYLPTFGGQAYYTFDRRENMKPLEFDPRHPLCWALDFNIDPMCSVIAQIIDTTTPEEVRAGRRSEVIHVLDEIVLHDARTPDAAAAFLRRIQPYLDRGVSAIQVFGDASGEQRRSSASKTDWQQVKEALRHELSTPITYRIPPANPSVRDRISHVCAALRSASGERRIFVDPKCKELTMDFEEVAWKRDAAGNPLDDLSKSDPRRTHISDALGYMVVQLRKQKTGFRSERIL